MTSRHLSLLALALSCGIYGGINLVANHFGEYQTRETSRHPQPFHSPQRCCSDVPSALLLRCSDAGREEVQRVDTTTGSSEIVLRSVCRLPLALSAHQAARWWDQLWLGADRPIIRSHLTNLATVHIYVLVPALIGRFGLSGRRPHGGRTAATGVHRAAVGPKFDPMDERRSHAKCTDVALQTP